MADLFFKPEVNHAIRFIHAKVFAAFKREAPLLKHIDEATRSCNDNVDPFAQRVRLLGH